MTEDDIKKLVRSKKAGSIQGIYGPNTLAGEAVWEVWTKDDGIFSTRFVTEPNDGEPSYFSSFEQFCGYVHRRLRAEFKEVVELRMKMATLSVAGLVFVATVATMLYIVVRSNDVQIPSLVLTAVLGIISSGSALFFGRWIHFPIGSRHEPQHREAGD